MGGALTDRAPLDPSSRVVTETPCDRREGALPAPYSLWHTVRFLRMGKGDPSVQLGSDTYVFVDLYDERVATVEVRTLHGRWQARAWGPGRVRALDTLPERLGLGRPLAPLTPSPLALHPMLSDHAGLHIARVHSLSRALLPTICQQKVTWIDAARTWRALICRWGAPAPGPYDLLSPPTMETLSHLTPSDMRQVGLPAQRARTLALVARRWRRIDKLMDKPPQEQRQALAQLSGLGPWTIESALGLWLGDLDAVPPGDIHLPHTVCWALAREARGDDKRMYELLEPWRGQRFKLMRLLYAAGAHAPRYGPRLSPRRKPHDLSDPSLR